MLQAHPWALLNSPERSAEVVDATWQHVAARDPQKLLHELRTCRSVLNLDASLLRHRAGFLTGVLGYGTPHLVCLGARQSVSKWLRELGVQKKEYDKYCSTLVADTGAE